jgi:uncharacterized protein (TIGR03083 family)
MAQLSPVLVNALFPEERTALLTVLEELTPNEWELSTICDGWPVYDIALHLLGDDIGLLSRRRDGYDRTALFTQHDLAQWDHLVAYINQQNALWVQALRRTSPQLVCQLLQVTGEELARYLDQVDLMLMGESVAWAGSGPAPVWLDIAREYTERWVHQQQIRDAVGRPGLQETRYLAPILATFVYALPQTLKETVVPEGTAIQLVITGDAGNIWTTVFQNGNWNLATGATTAPTTQVIISADRAWRLFTNGLTRAQASEASYIVGDLPLGEKVLETVAIIA